MLIALLKGKLERATSLEFCVDQRAGFNALWQMWKPITDLISLSSHWGTMTT